jgi:Subtilase family/Cohesin domain
MKQISFLLIILASLPMFAFAQNKSTGAFRDSVFRQAEVERLSAKAESAQARAWAAVGDIGWGTSGKMADGGDYILIGLDGDVPVYYITDNDNAAISTAANLVRNIAPYNLTGAGFTVGIWDSGSSSTLHQEFGGRAIYRDAAPQNVRSHSTHVAGTIGAAGVVSRAKGMAPQVTVNSYSSSNDESEMASRAAAYPNQTDKIYVSNHSYSKSGGWGKNSSGTWYWQGTWGNSESHYFGLYDGAARDWDTICYNAPYYLPFKSAGNDRNDNAPPTGTEFRYNYIFTATYDPNTHPGPDYQKGGYDTISTYSNAKNIMTVGSVNDAVSSGNRSLGNASISSFSSWGPTDDGRIKPDIVANGAGLYSTNAVDGVPLNEQNITSYGSKSGTSMSSPNAAGSAILLQEHYGNLFAGGAMRSSTLKGLIIHTCDDLSTAGPDYSFGWGLMNTKAAADQITKYSDDPLGWGVVEETLNAASSTHSFQAAWNGIDPIRVTICWTDPPASSISSLNNPSPRLINDLDIRVYPPGGGAASMPFILDPGNPAQAATTGDNVLDNVEQVNIASPVAGDYTVQVSHKGTLTNNEQIYSLLVSGLAGEAAPTRTPTPTPTGTNTPTGTPTPTPKSLTIVDSSGVPGTSASVPVLMTGANQEYSLAFDVVYDASVLAFSSLSTNRSFVGSSFLFSSTEESSGSLHIYGIFYQFPGAQPFSGDGRLLNIFFDVAPDAAPGSQVELALANPSGGLTGAKLQNGFVSITTPAPTPSPTPVPLSIFDLNMDMWINDGDLLIFYGSMVSDETQVGDFNKDNQVDVSDLLMFSRHWSVPVQ